MSGTHLPVSSCLIFRWLTWVCVNCVSQHGQCVGCRVPKPPCSRQRCQSGGSRFDGASRLHHAHHAFTSGHRPTDAHWHRDLSPKPWHIWGVSSEMQRYWGFWFISHKCWNTVENIKSTLKRETELSAEATLSVVCPSEVFPLQMEGVRLVVNKGLSNHFQVSANVPLGFPYCNTSVHHSLHRSLIILYCKFTWPTNGKFYIRFS